LAYHHFFIYLYYMVYKNYKYVFICLAIFSILLLAIYKTFTTENFYATVKIRSKGGERTYPLIPGPCLRGEIRGCDGICRLPNNAYIKACNGCVPRNRAHIKGCNGCVPPNQALYYRFVRIDDKTEEIYCGDKKVGFRKYEGAVKVEGRGPTSKVLTTKGG